MFTIRAVMHNAARNTENKGLREYTFPVLLCIYRQVKLLSHTAALGSPGGSDGKESACNADDPWVPSLGQEETWEEAWRATPLSLPGELHGQGSPAGYSPWGREESDMTEATQHKHRKAPKPFT